MIGYIQGQSDHRARNHHLQALLLTYFIIFSALLYFCTYRTDFTDFWTLH